MKKNIIYLSLIFVFISINVFSQNITIQGEIRDSNGEKLPGVTIVVEGTTLGAISDSEGSFHLDIPSSGSNLQFSFIGMKTQIVPINGRTQFDIIMEQETVGIEEVVAIGYGTTSVKDVTGSISSVKSELLEKRQVTSFDQSLQGMTSGVQVFQNNGAPGGTITVRVRGSNSIMGGNEPLYVIDGVPMISGNSGNSNLLSTINPNDIESMDILKDASSTAIYGARGANGVILISTKSGTKRDNQVDFEYSFGVQNVIKKIDMLNARQFAELVNERALNDNEGFVPYPDLENIPTETNWQDEVYRLAPVQNYQLSFSGGTDKLQYFLSGNYFNQQGLMPNTEFQRYSARINIESQISERFSIGTQVHFSETYGNRTATENNNYGLMLALLGGAPNTPVYNEDGSYGDPFPAYFTENYNNPLAILNERLDVLTTNRIIGNFNAKYEIINGLDYEVRFGLDRLISENDDYINRTLTAGEPGGKASKSYSKNNVVLVENLIHYNKKAGNHKLNITFGNTLQGGETTSFGASAQDFLTDDFLNNNLGAGASFGSPSSNLTDWSLNSWIGRIIYSYDEKYIITLTGRADGSSRFGKGNKWGKFPSAAIAWRLNEEPFMSNFSSISNAKLRASWGVTGNQEIGLYQSLQQIKPVTLAFANAVVIGFAPYNIANPDLKWEETAQFNIGFDLGFWDQRLSLSSDFYVKNTTNLLSLVNLPPSSGFGTSIQNIGSIQNKGLELSLNASLFRNKEFAWDIVANWSTNKNKVTELAGDNDLFGVNGKGVIRVGEPLANFYDYVLEGIDETTGNAIYKDLDGEDGVNSLDREILGYAEPDFIYGVTNNLAYKHFNLSFFIQGVQGNEIYDESYFLFANSMIRARNLVADVYDQRWSPDAPSSDAKFPKISVQNSFKGGGAYAVEDGSYLRLKNVRLSYNITPGKLKYFRKATIYFSAQNLFTLTKYRWVDPDVSSYGTNNVAQGIDRLSYPTSKTYTIGVQLGF